MKQTIAASAVADLRRAVAGEVLDDAVNRAMAATDASPYREMPALVVRPRNAEDVAAVVAWAARTGVTLHGRGAGSGLTGACLGEGVVVDFRRHMTEILALDPEAGTVTVQPGLVHTALNDRLARDGLFFPPDPASGDYCSLGGMLANNSSGARSVKYGATIDYVEELDVVVPGQGPLRLGRARPDGSGDAVGRLAAGVEDLRPAHEEAFRAALPRAPKNCSGYRLERAWRDDGTVDLARLMVGSEGTLGLITAATLKVRPLPATRRLALLNFASLPAMGAAVARIVPLKPSAIEIMDRHFLALVRERRPDLRDYLPEGTAAQLLVELDGTASASADAASRLRSLASLPDFGAMTFVEAEDPARQEALWSVRRAALPLLFTLPGPARITPFIEDVCVAPEHLATYLERLHAIFDRHGVASAVYGHAGDGNLHTRPLLDLRDPAQVDLMERLADEVYAVVTELRGSISGEHGDGRLRTPFLPRMLGPAYEAINAVKTVFDPARMLNPGIVADAGQRRMRDDLRMGPSYRRHGLTSRAGGGADDLAAAIERCHGCGKCTTPSETVRMCPLYKALGTPESSPRGKMTLAQALLDGTLELDRPLAERLRTAFAHCLGCGLCELDCPSTVDTPTVVKQMRALLSPRTDAPLADSVAALLGAPIPALVQPFLWATEPLTRLRVIRRLMEAFLGIDAAAPLLTFSARRLGERTLPGPEPCIYFPDTVAAFCEPELSDIACTLLSRAGLAAATSPLLMSAAPALSAGDPDLARKVASRALAALAPHLGPRTPVVVSEPTALRVVAHDWPRLLDGDETAKRVAGLATSLCRLLLERLGDGALPQPSPPDAPLPGPLVYHTPCHVRGTEAEGRAVELLRRVGYEIDPLPTSCCGMAGAFGIRASHPGATEARAVGAPVFAAVTARHPALVVSECSACRLQIAGATGVRAVHPAVLVAARYVTGPLPSGGSR